MSWLASRWPRRRGRRPAAADRDGGRGGGSAAGRAASPAAGAGAGRRPRASSRHASSSRRWDTSQRSRKPRRCSGRARPPCRSQPPSSYPRPSARRVDVARASNEPRTQNGHIRNDTRDASRRLAVGGTRAICRRKCVARDRACTRVTLPNLHGKEGVSGSSPEEGSDQHRAVRPRNIWSSRCVVLAAFEGPNGGDRGVCPAPFNWSIGRGVRCTAVG
jgi:hypothetical protein